MIKLRPVGIVRNRIRTSGHRDWRRVESRIIIEPEFEPALDGIEGFSNIIVVFWMDRLEPRGREVLKVHPQGDKGLPMVGVFSARSPVRPNPLGLTTVRLVERKRNVLKVAGLDAMNGTPVIDIKPFIPGHDLPKDAKVPGWLKEAERRHKH
ncbi:MAG: tRNA (N6-threonylcarbamoyladenosine(37)-N6)-methyltransferase TrmO [Chloroflexota bacterium]